MKIYTDWFKHLFTVSIVLGLALPIQVFAVAGKFQFVNGEVQVLDASGKVRAVKKGDAVDEGETVASGATGFAQIKMEDGGFFAVRPDTKFKIDTFKYEGKDDGSEQGAFSLIKGSLRSVTGVIGKKHKENYKITTATSTIGIRGSGADVGHNDAIGTAVRTLFGGHSLTSGGKTIITGPGQTAFAPPGETPKFVSNFPFNTSTTGTSNNGASEDGGDNSPPAESRTRPDVETSVVGGDEDKVVIPVVDNEGELDLTNQKNGGDDIGGSFSFAGTGKLPTGSYKHFISALNDTYGDFFVAEQSADGQAYSPGNYTFDGSGALISVANSKLEIGDAGGFSSYGVSSLSVIDGNLEELYYTPDMSIIIGRASDVSVNTVCGSCSGTDTFVSVHSLVGLVTAPAFVQTLTGSANYALAGSTHPSDGHGNVGTLNSAYINADFTNMQVDFGLNLSIAGKTLDAQANNIPIVHDGFDADSSHGLNVTCSGGACAGGYDGDVGGAFFGSAAKTAGMGYSFWPSSNVSGLFTDYIHGLAAFIAGTTPTATPSTAGVVGGGGAAVGSFTSAPGDDFNDFNVVDNVNFAARHDSSGNVIAWVKSSSNDTSFSARGTVVQDGSDSSLGVIWGRWSAFSATVDIGGGSSYNLPTQGGLSFITGAHITTASERAALGPLVANYSMATAGVASIPTGVNGVASGTITSASATVNFGTGSITTFNVAGSGGAYGTWSASGAGTIANFITSAGITLSGSCTAGSGSCVMSDTLNGKAVGGFVGTQAQGLISTVGLQATGGDKLGGAVYMKR